MCLAQLGRSHAHETDGVMPVRPHIILTSSMPPTPHSSSARRSEPHRSDLGDNNFALRLGRKCATIGIRSHTHRQLVAIIELVSH